MDINEQPDPGVVIWHEHRVMRSNPAPGPTRAWSARRGPHRWKRGILLVVLITLTPLLGARAHQL